MKISTKGRYALRVMLDMALHSGGECVKVKDMASRQNVSEKYLEQIISILNRAGYVRSIRGAQGGYLLTKALKAYTVGDIIRLTEGSLAPVSCLESNINTCERVDICDTLWVWQKLYDAVNDVVNQITLEDLVNHHNQRLGLLDYSI